MLRNVNAEPRTPEGALIRDAIARSLLSTREIARRVPITDTQLRNWYRGVDGKGNEVNFPARRLAKVAIILGVTSEELRSVDRPDAAEIRDRIERENPEQSLTPEERDSLLLHLAKRVGQLEETLHEIRQREAGEESQEH